jgi:hypothetical protein
MERGQLKISGLDYDAVKSAAKLIGTGKYSDALDYGVELRENLPNIHTFTIHRLSKLDPK